MDAVIVYHGRIRPAHYLGVSQQWLVVEILTPLVAFIATYSFWPLVALPVMHVFGVVCMAYDRQFFEVEIAKAGCYSPLRRVFGHNVYIE